MNKTLKRKLAKERSLVLKLTPKQITEILSGCGFVIDHNIYDELGEHIPAISKYYNRENDEYVVEIKCKPKPSDEQNILHNALARIPHFGISSYSELAETSIILLKDYSFSELSLFSDPDKSLEHNTFYAKYMYNLFGEYYRKKYNQLVKKEQKEQTK